MSKSLAGALNRLNSLPSNTTKECPAELWDDQWLNWDDLGKDDDFPGGWGDVGS